MVSQEEFNALERRVNTLESRVNDLEEYNTKLKSALTDIQKLFATQQYSTTGTGISANIVSMYNNAINSLIDVI